MPPRAVVMLRLLLLLSLTTKPLAVRLTCTRSARHAYTSAVEVNNLAQGALLDARDRLTAAWEAEDEDEGLSAGSEDSEGSVASEG